MVSQQLLRQRLGINKQQATTRVSVDIDFCLSPYSLTKSQWIKFTDEHEVRLILVNPDLQAEYH